MTYKAFTEVFKRLPTTVRTLQFGCYGEPYMNSDLNKMVKLAQAEGVRSIVYTNGTLLDATNVDGLIDAKTSRIIVGIDGASQETYEKYRISGSFEQVLENTRKMNMKKRNLGLSYPFTVLQFIVMKQNQNEMNKIVDLASDLAFDAITIITLSLGSFHPSSQVLKALADEYLPREGGLARYDRDAEGNIKNKYRDHFKYCTQWKTPVIYYNGDMTICCLDSEGEHVYDNIFNHKSLKDLWHNPIHVRQMKKIIKREFALCERCSICAGDELAALKHDLRQKKSDVPIQII